MHNARRGIPKLIFITGVDGSGKTYFSDKLFAELKAAGVQTSRLWLRFSNITSKPLLGFCRLIGLNYYVKKDGVTVGYHDFERSRIISSLFIILQLIDVWLVTVFRVWPKVLMGDVVVCDRGVYDTLIDVMVDTKISWLHTTKVGKAFLCLLPKPHLALHILRDQERIFQLRPDVRADRNFDLRRKLYSNCSEYFQWDVICNNGTPEAAFSEIMVKICSG